MTDPLAEDIRNLAASVPLVRAYRGTYAGRIDGQPQVDMNGARIPATLMCLEPPVTTDVHVWLFAEQWFITGFVTQPPITGVVSVVGATRTTVITDQGEFSVPFMSSYTPSSGHTVKLGFDSGGLYVMGRLSEEPVPIPAPDLPAADQDRQTDLFTATASGSARQGTDLWFTNQVYASKNADIGIYVYGSKVRDTLATAPPVTKLEVYLPVVTNRYGNMRLGWHSLETRAGTTPAITRLRTVSDGWVDITDLAPTLRTGGGIGFDGAGETIFKGVPMDGKPGDRQAGALRVTY